MPLAHEGVRQARLVAALAPEILARQETQQGVRRGATPHLCRVEDWGAQRLADGREETRPVRRHQTPAIPGPGPSHTERMERHSRRVLPKGSRQVLGGNPRPRFTVRATGGSRPRTESRMWGNSHVRFGAGDEETCPGNGARRFIPTLPENPVRTLTLGALRGVPAEGGVPATKAPARGKAFLPNRLRRSGERLSSNHHAADLQLSWPVVVVAGLGGAGRERQKAASRLAA